MPELSTLLHFAMKVRERLKKKLFWLNFHHRVRAPPSHQNNIATTSTQLKRWVWHENDFSPPTTTHTNSMSAISQLLLTRFWWNFKGRFLETFRTDSNCQGYICPRNICPRNICPYQEYLSCYWPDFDETLQVGSWKHLEQIPTVRVTFVHATFVLATFVHVRNISAVSNQILTKL